MMVDLPENGAVEPALPPAPAMSMPPQSEAAIATPPPPAVAMDPARLSELTAQVRQVFQRAAQPPRWPMYIRQLKQYLRANDKGLEEQTAGQGALLDLMRACQREGILRLERDRRGQMRVFPGPALAAASVPMAMVSDISPVAEELIEPVPLFEAAVEEVNGNVASLEEHPAAAAPGRARRTRKPPAAGARKRAPRKPARKPVN
jgi:hypothetical protein